MNIGVYRACGIGDFVQVTPLLQQIRADLPDARITLFTSANVAGLLPGCPWIDWSVTFSSELLRGWRARLGGIPIWWRIRRGSPWDLLLSLEPHWRRAAGSVLVRAARKGGFETEGWKPVRLFDERFILHPQGCNRGHASQWYLDLWQRLAGHADRGFGCDVHYLLKPELGVPPIPPDAVCLAPGAGNVITPAESKRWPRDCWLKLAGLLRGRGFATVWLGGPEDAAAFSAAGLSDDFMGRLDLQQTAAVIRRSRAVIGSDSGLFHLALGLGTPAIGLFGPTNPQNTGPFRNERSLVFKAGFGPVPAALLTGATGADLEALQRRAPMETLNPDQLAPPIAEFLAATTSGVP